MQRSPQQWSLAGDRSPASRYITEDEGRFICAQHGVMCFWKGKEEYGAQDVVRKAPNGVENTLIIGYFVVHLVSLLLDSIKFLLKLKYLCIQTGKRELRFINEFRNV